MTWSAMGSGFNSSLTIENSCSGPSTYSGLYGKAIFLARACCFECGVDVVNLEYYDKSFEAESTVFTLKYFTYF
jgi:hypothetical protein